MVAESAPRDSAAVDSLARGIAVALADDAVRLRLFEDLRDSPISGYRLPLSSYFAGTRGARVLHAAARASGLSVTRIVELVSGSSRYELSLPRVADRVRWSGTNDIVVFGTSKTIAERAVSQRPESGYDVRGEGIAVPVWSYARYPFIAITPIGRPFKINRSRNIRAARGSQPATVSTPEEEMYAMLSSEEDACDPEVSIVECPSSDPVGTTSRVIPLPTGYSYNYCYNGAGFPTGVDADQDQVRDECEFALAYAFRPRMVFDSDDDNIDREPYWSVRKVDASDYSISIFYAISYREDGGTPNGGFYAHQGDTEFVIVQAAPTSPTSNNWMVKRATLSAHWGKPTNETATYSGADLEYGSDNRPRVWVAEDKHANYRTKAACDAGAFYADNCNDGQDLGETLDILPDANLGQSGGLSGGGRGVPLIWCRGSRTSSYLGNECFWYMELQFHGWHSPRTGEGSGPYAESLVLFGF